MPSIRDLKILLVDDDLLTLECFNVFLRQQKAEVKTASTVAEALNQMEAWHPNFVVTDISLPGEDGYHLIRKMRAHESTKGVPVIVMTGYETDSVKEKMQKEPFVTAISKPVDPEYLVTIIQKLSA